MIMNLRVNVDESKVILELEKMGYAVSDGREPELIARYTDDELLQELDRRGWLLYEREK